MFMNYRIDRNNFYQKPKNSNVYTPPEVSQFIYELLKDKINKKRTLFVFDPCSGIGNLLKPWKEAGYETLANDSDTSLWKQGLTDYDLDFLHDWKKPICPPSQLKTELKAYWLILCNPPFNGYGQKLGSEVWLDKIIELFGKEVPLVLFTPMGFRLNSKKNGKRWGKFTNNSYPPISSIISLPRDIFPAIEFHSEILIFNIPNLQPHYFYHEIP